MAFHDIVAAEVRAELARRQLSGVRAGKALGWSQYYISIRLRGEIPFSLSDLEAVADLLEIPVATFFGTAEGLKRSVTCPSAADLGLAA